MGGASSGGGRPGPVIRRERLLSGLAGLLARKLTVVLAPGGYGKTTLLRGLEQHLAPVPFAWCSLEPGGGSLPAFLRAMAAAVAPHLPGGSHIAALGADRGAGEEVRDLALQFAADLAEQPEEHLVLVLDDLHHADGTPAVWTFLEALLAALPPGVHLLAAGRTRPRLPLARLHSRGEVLQVTAADLSFQPAETRAFFRALTGQELAPAELDLVQQHTEGWAVGLLLLANALRGRPAAERLALLQRLEERRDLFDYMAQEVFAAQPPEVQDFLLRSAVLADLDPALLHAILPGAPVGRLLERLEEQHLFLAAAPPGGHPRYHTLFRTFLLQQARRHLGAPALAALHRQAAAALDHRQPDRALHHLVAAGDWLAAAPLLAERVDACLKGLRQEEVHAWLEQAPPDLAHEHPDLLYVRLQLATWLNQYDVAPGLYERTLDLYLAAGNRPGLIRTLDSLQHHYYKVRRPFVDRIARVCSQHPDPEIALRGQQLLAAGRIAAGQWAEGLADLEALVPQMPAGSMARCNCQENLALFSFFAADFRRCLQHGVEEVAARNARGDFSWGVYNWASHVFVGDLVGLEIYQRQFAAMAVPAAARRLHGVVTQMGQAILHQMKGEWDLAIALFEGLRPYLNDGETIKPSLGPDSTFVVRAELARLYQRQGRREEAGELLERNLALTARYPELIALACAQLAEHRAAARDLPGARTYLEKARAALPPGLAGLARLAVEVAAARVHGAAGDMAAAAAALDWVLGVALAKGCPYLVVHYGQEALPPLLAHLQQRPEYRERAAAWLRALGALAQRLPGAPAPELRVYALGRCAAYVQDRPVGGPDWNRAKVRLLLIGLLLRRGRPTGREELLRWLWPGGDPAAHRTSLRVTLYGLKRALEPGLPPGAPSRFLRTDGDQIRLADPEQIWFDLWEFEDRIARGRQALRQGDAAAGLACLQEAVDLWQGPLLPDPSLAGYLTERRVRVEQAFVRACLDLASHSLARGEAHAAAALARRALQADPAAEAAYQILIRAHLARGDRTAALLAWKACRKHLRQHLGVEPSPDTAGLLQ